MQNAMMSRQPLTRAERKLQTREAIIDAAARLFGRHGIEATSLDAIAAHVGLTKGAVYANFASKRDLMKAVAVRHSAPADFTPLLRSDLPLAERLRLFGRGLATMLQGVTRQLLMLDFEYQVYAKRDRHWGKMLRESNRANINEVATRFQAVNAARGEEPPLGAEEFLGVIMMVARGIVQQLALDPESVSVAGIETLFGLLAGS